MIGLWLGMGLVVVGCVVGGDGGESWGHIWRSGLGCGFRKLGNRSLRLCILFSLLASLFSLFPLFFLQNRREKGKQKLKTGKWWNKIENYTKYSRRKLSLTMNNVFLDASSHLYQMACLLVGRSLCICDASNAKCNEIPPFSPN